MNNILKKLLVILAVVTSYTGHSTGGSMSSGGGGELVTWEHNPWLLGEGSVRYCVVEGARFSLSPQVARQELQAAFTNWVEALKRLDQHPTRFTLASGETGLKLPTAFIETPCADEPDLTVYLGAKTPEIEALLKGHAHFTVAFAQMTAFDTSRGRGRGVLWFASDIGAQAYAPPGVGSGFWSVPQVFFNVALHETGHVFGLRHAHGGVMADDFPASTVASASAYGPSRASAASVVDQSWWLRGQKLCVPVRPNDDTLVATLKLFGFRTNSLSVDSTLCLAGDERWRNDPARHESEELEYLRYDNWRIIPGWEMRDPLHLTLTGGGSTQDLAIDSQTLEYPDWEPIEGRYESIGRKLHRHWFVRFATSYRRVGTAVIADKKAPITIEIKGGDALVRTFTGDAYAELRLAHPVGGPDLQSN